MDRLQLEVTGNTKPPTKLILLLESCRMKELLIFESGTVVLDLTTELCVDIDYFCPVIGCGVGN